MLTLKEKMEEIKNFKRSVWRGKRPKLTLTLHPDIEKVIRQTAKDEKLAMSVVADEALYTGLKEMGRI